ncbi:polysaccharide biosynthesis protein [Halodesulfovibrio marinisediminis]|uniref:NDP-sugar epimerase, includes UDP-GlcNAc-inverting 4,6-dehydratase FlaA1 and capsular polysaccharide biosynthesis protein EpsC n=1 Tax=Halodesulfovibrio marinisediminis DSM 17456 TaxID=1121457 RepID=A0A1N6FTV9_9BACT|nr:nucleoside-diphosphate sugar epimerase/dehydratase [Halodesulfovibrio marinisediminis]SIN98688.1 NDP-sugar epimerase, includes UDP-GlcNAc-inverting 4,6-dehydratase FlaA1 and capsular polysaccharide biosynthesis protein EpsC [Halodesulfovibrio marinisediminis DSM 17456]
MFSNLGLKLIALSRAQKKALMLLADFILIPLALWGAWALRLGELWPTHLASSILLFPLLVFGSMIFFVRLGLYRAVIHFMGIKAIRTIALGVCVSSWLLFSLAFILRIESFPRSVPFIYSLLLFICVGGSRWTVRTLYHHLRFKQHAKHPVIIYGAGEAGFQLAKSLIAGEDFFPSAFLDDDKALHNCIVHDIKVYPPEQLASVIAITKAKRVLLAVPSATQEERKKILDKLDGHSLRVQTIPSLEAIVSDKARLNQLQDVAVEDLLGRDPVPPREELFSACIKEKNVLVTGAGGSIGSELCRQIVRAKPNVLVLYELTELALYTIDQELHELLKELDSASIQVIPVLGSVCDRQRLNEVFIKYDINTVYHAAAYKHVPLVEGNVFQGIKNNIFGTKILAESAEQAGVKNFVLISTDKAVRPTNVMGATKRTAELILQAMAAKESKTVFSMVRFGNVLGSSGSVVPLFKKQIASGGPLTVTHKDITRYFMTIPEAAQLVIQAGAMGIGGDVFVLDMGSSVKVLDMARRMVWLSGKTIKDAEHPNGDIEISVVGLRPGEKLYEELLVGDNVQQTKHPKIMQAHEVFLSLNVLEEKLSKFALLEVENDCLAARNMLQEIVSGFTPNSPIVDSLYNPTKEVA